MAVVTARFVKRGKVGNAKAKDTVRYIQHRRGRENERAWRPLFTSDGPMIRPEAYQFIDEAPKGTKFFTIIISPDPEREDTQKDLDMREITKSTMQTVEEIITAQGITTPVNWVAAVHDDHTDKNHVHVLTTKVCREQRRELDRALSRQAREREQEAWEPEPQLQEDLWAL
jgi:hypothetical protein